MRPLRSLVSILQEVQKIADCAWYHVRVPCLGFALAHVVQDGERFRVLSERLQDAFRLLGRIPAGHRSESLKAASVNLSNDGEDLTDRCRSLWGTTA